MNYRSEKGCDWRFGCPVCACLNMTLILLEYPVTISYKSQNSGKIIRVWRYRSYRTSTINRDNILSPAKKLYHYRTRSTV